MELFSCLTRQTSQPPYRDCARPFSREVIMCMVMASRKRQRTAILAEVRPELDPWMQKVREEAAKLEEPFKTLYLRGMEKIKGRDYGRWFLTPENPNGNQGR